MAFGPGKYDDLCSYVREQVGMTEKTGGAVVLIVLGGKHGNGFSCQADLQSTMALPDMLEEVAKQIRKEIVG